MSPGTRVAYLDTLFQDNNIEYTQIEHIYSGPKENRKLTEISLVEFQSNKTAQNALSKLGGKGREFEISDSVTVTLKPAVTMINLKRNYNLRKAHDLIKKSPTANNKEIRLEFKDRKILMQRQTVFSQSPNQLKGTFLAPFTDLSFP